VGCERSELQEPDIAALLLVIRSHSDIRLHAKAQATHPSPPLLSQGREQIEASHGAMTLKCHYP